METNSIKKILCSGGLFLSRESKRFLFLQRSQGKTANTWSLVGGKKEDSDQTLIDTLNREILEEITIQPKIKKIIPLEVFVSNDLNFQYNTYILLVDKEFVPILNHEHSGYCWCDFGFWPKPLHQNLKPLLNSKNNKIKLKTIIEIFN
jgi:8-oxo-dGTP pyrophosphatase MutT (NUDIX family)